MATIDSIENAIEEKRGPGRPREFDRQAALNAAMVLFWKHGFDATSMTDLTHATGMSKPTLYATFGDKVDLFREAVLAYSQFMVKAYEEVLNRLTTREVLEATLRLARGFDPVSGEPVVCFLMQGALLGSANTQALRDELTEMRRQATARLQQRLERAQREGDLPPTTDITVLAQYLTSVAVGISVQAASGTPPEQLDQVVAMVLQQWPGK